MLKTFRLLGFCIVMVWAALAHGEDKDSCECPKLTCRADCEIEQDLTFYSEKCDGGKRVKSCARPTCVSVQNAPASCGISSVEPSNGAENPIVRDVASDSKAQAESIGKINFVEGTVNRVVSSSDKQALNVGDEISEGDRLETEADSKAQITFFSGNELNLTPNSIVVISDASDSKKASSKKTLILDLIKGRVRNRVNTKYENNDQSHYRVRTGAAVAGVRGTDFIVSIDSSKKDIVSKIETMGGQVELSDQNFEEKAFISKGEAGTFVMPADGVFNEKDKEKFKKKGYLTPVYKLSKDEIAKLQEETQFLVAKRQKSIASKQAPSIKTSDLPICANPSGSLNQCAWSCENNPLGENRCRTDLPEVSCVRRICNANGDWSQPTRLPASYHESCMANKAVVKGCDY